MHDLREQIALLEVTLALDIGVEAERRAAHSLLDYLLDAVECAAADEEDIRGIDLDELLLGMLSAALRGNIGNRALDYLEQRLLNAFAADISCYRRILRLSRYFINLIDIDYAALGALYVVVRSLDYSEQDVFNILADITGFGKRGRVRYGERNIEYLREGLRKHRLAHTRGSEKNDIALLNLNIAVLRAVYSLIVVIDRNTQRFLRLVLTYNILVELLFDLMGLGERLVARALTALAAGTLFVRLNYIEALLHTLVADIHPRTSNKLLDLILCFLAERTADCPFPLIIITRHNSPPDLSVVNYFICKSVLDGFLRCEEIVALGLALNKLNRFAHILS